MPVIDIGALVDTKASEAGRRAAADAIGAACREHGFFYISHHGVPQSLIDRLHALSQEFFSWPEEKKMQWRMALGGRAWRGFSRWVAS